MTKKGFTVFMIAASTVLFSSAQTMTPQQYIDTYKDLAIREMKRMGVPAAITLAQGLLETESGNSDLVKKSNNHFGIKCKSSWTGDAVNHDDDASGECFRTYKDAEGSYRDHSNFLRGSDRYAFLFSLDPTDYKGWAWGLKKAGYATNPKYPDILIKNIEMYNLQQYSIAGAKEMPKFDRNKYQDDKEEPVDVSDNDQQSTDVQAEFTVSENVIHVNGNKCIYAKQGTSLLAVASNYNVQLSRLLEFNDLEEDGMLKKDQLIFLERKSKKGDKEFYIAQAGESLYDVSQKNGIQLERLLAYNQLHKSSVVKPGTKIYLQEIKETSQAEATAVATTQIKMYEVQPKDGLYSIARKYGVSVQQLRDWNNLTTDNLSIGQQLIVAK